MYYKLSTLIITFRKDPNLAPICQCSSLFAPFSAFCGTPPSENLTFVLLGLKRSSTVTLFKTYIPYRFVKWPLHGQGELLE